MFFKLRKKEIIALAIIVILFVAASYLSHRYAPDLKNLIQPGSVSGMALYILITILGVVIAPVSTFPLLPVAVAIWGPLGASVLSILGWEFGAVIAFGLARAYGRPLISRIINIKKLERIENLIPERNLFGAVIFARIALPVDILSYALGLFSKMSWASYSLATLIGITPFAFIFSYGSVIPVKYQVLAGLTGLLFVLFGYNRFRKIIINWFNK